MKDMYQLRGLSVGPYNLANALYKSGKKVPKHGFSNVGESVNNAFHRLIEFPKELLHKI